MTAAARHHGDVTHTAADRHGRRGRRDQAGRRTQVTGSSQAPRGCDTYDSRQTWVWEAAADAGWTTDTRRRRSSSHSALLAYTLFNNFTTHIRQNILCLAEWNIYCSFQTCDCSNRPKYLHIDTKEICRRGRVWW